LPAGTDRPQTLVLRGQMPMSAVGQGVWLPEVSVQGLTRQQTWLAVAGKGLVASGARGLVLQPNLAATLAAWRPGGLADAWAREAERLRRSGGKLWKVASEAWSLRVAPSAERMPQTQALKSLLAEQQSAVVDGERWLHEASWWVEQTGPAARSGGGLTVILPRPGKVLAVAVDGLEVQPVRIDPRALWLPLVGAGGPRQVRLRWQYGPGDERFDRPNLAMPVLQGAQPGRALWTVLIPTGYTLKDRSGVGLRSGPQRLARLFLERASVQESLAVTFAEKNSEADRLARKAALERLGRFCRLAEQQLELADGPVEKGPDGQTLAEWLGSLQTRLRQEGRESKPEAAEVLLPAFDPEPFMTGIACAGTSSSEQAVPEVVLVSERSRQDQRALAASGEWLALLGIAWLLTLVPYLPKLARLLWPEQLLLLASGLWLAGVAQLAVGAVLLGLLARLGFLVRWRRH